MRRKPGRAGRILEFAFVVPVFFTLIFAFVEFGRAFMVLSLLNNAARAGCRTAILANKSNTDIQTAVTNTLTKQGLPSITPTVKINNVEANASTAKSGDEITVTLQVPISQVSWLPNPLFTHGNLRGQFTLPKE